MASTTVRFPVDNAGGSTDCDRSLSASLWGKSLEEYQKDSPELGQFVFNDFKEEIVLDASTPAAYKGWWAEDSAAGGTNEALSTLAGPDGVLRMAATTGTDHFGIEVHRGDQATSRSWVPTVRHATDARGRVIYEARVDLSASDQYFLGLAEAAATFLSATSTLPTDRDYIGFFRSDAGALNLVLANDNNGGSAVAQVVVVLTALQIAALTGFVKVGFAVNKDGTVDIFINGVYQSIASTVNPLAIPIEYLTETFSSTRGATGDLATVTIDCDWVGVFVAAS